MSRSTPARSPHLNTFLESEEFGLTHILGYLLIRLANTSAVRGGLASPTRQSQSRIRSTCDGGRRVWVTWVSRRAHLGGTRGRRFRQGLERLGVSEARRHGDGTVRLAMGSLGLDMHRTTRRESTSLVVHDLGSIKAPDGSKFPELGEPRGCCKRPSLLRQQLLLLLLISISSTPFDP